MIQEVMMWIKCEMQLRKFAKFQLIFKLVKVPLGELD